MNQEHSAQFLRRRKFLIVLPLIVLPFAVLLFWLLGGGSGSKPVVQKKAGLNTQLPDANLKKESALDKMSFYAMADRDSVKRAQQIQMDPNYQGSKSVTHLPKYAMEDPLARKISRLQKEVWQSESGDKSYQKTKVESSGDLEQLHQMVSAIHQKKADPDIEALNVTLDKLLEIQHPGRTQRQTFPNEKIKVYSVTTNGSSREQNYFGAVSAKRTNGFFSDEEEQSDSVKAGVIMAVVHNEQILLAGSVVKLRLLQDVFVNNERILAGSFVFGNAEINNDRIKVMVSSIQFQNQLYPVSLSVFDMDGLEGIHIPGSSDREVVKQSADQGIQSLGGLAFDPSIGAQVAATGLNAAKSLLSKKVKQVRVTVKAGYRVLLRNENQKK